MTLKELRVKRGKWVPKADYTWIRMMKRRAKKLAKQKAKKLAKQKANK